MHNVEIFSITNERRIPFRRKTKRTASLNNGFFRPLKICVFLRNPIVLLEKNAAFYLFGYQISTAAAVIFVSAIGFLVIGRFDIYVYHPMLRGAVAFGQEIEKQNTFRELSQTKIGLTQTITKYSRGDRTKKSSKQVTARNRIEKEQ